MTSLNITLSDEGESAGVFNLRQEADDVTHLSVSLRSERFFNEQEAAAAAAQGASATELSRQPIRRQRLKQLQ